MQAWYIAKGEDASWLRVRVHEFPATVLNLKAGTKVYWNLDRYEAQRSVVAYVNSHMVWLRGSRMWGRSEGGPKHAWRETCTPNVFPQ